MEFAGRDGSVCHEHQPTPSGHSRFAEAFQVSKTVYSATAERAVNVVISVLESDEMMTEADLSESGRVASMKID